MLTLTIRTHLWILSTTAALLLFVSTVSLVYALQGQEQEKKVLKWLTYTDPSGVFSIQYPDNWSATGSILGTDKVILKPNNSATFNDLAGLKNEMITEDKEEYLFYGPKILVSAMTLLYPDLTVNELCNHVEGSLERLGYTIYHFGEKSLPNISEIGCTFQYADEDGKYNNPTIDTFLDHDKKVYMIEYSTLDSEKLSEYGPIMEKIVNSIEFR